MQNNEGLMRNLVKLVNVNKPDLILFVGEALVGNDGVDQLKEFNRVGTRAEMDSRRCTTSRTCPSPDWWTALS